MAFLLPLAVVAQKKDKINWVSVEEAQKLAAEDTTKVIMIDVYTSWCGPCKMMTKNTFGEKKTIDYINKNIIAVKFNAESNDTVTFNGHPFTNPGYDPARAHTRNSTHEFASIASNNGRLSYPTLVFLNHKSEIITPVSGYLKPDQLEPILHFLATSAYLTQDYEAFKKSFKSSYPTSPAPGAPKK